MAADTTLEKGPMRDNGRLDSETEYLYLTFDTQLPPSAKVSAEATQKPPECPSLTVFVSPFSWSGPRKALVTVICCCAASLSSYAAGAYTAPAEELRAKWNVSSTVFNLGVTLYMVTFAFAPMILAPFSEINGRRPVFVLSGLAFTACLFGSGAANSIAGMLVARFFLGIGGSTFSTIIGGILSDIYPAEHRNIPMACFSGSVFFATGLGPLIPSFIVTRTSWRWVHYSLGIVSGTFVLLLFLFLSETRGSVLLSCKAKALNRYYDELETSGYGLVVGQEGTTGTEIRRVRWKVAGDEERESVWKMIRISSSRPFHMLFTEPVVFSFSLWVSFSWGVLFLQFIAIPLVFTTQYNFTVEQNGAVFAAVSIGSIIATLISVYQEKLALRFIKDPENYTPERRLYLSCVQSVLMPAGLFWFGWTASPSIPWIVPTIAIACATIGIYSIYLATYNYLADTYHRYASSAIAAQSFCRNILAAIFPLVTNPMFNHLGFAQASSLLGGIGVLLTAVPWALIMFGPRIRARSRLASEIMQGSY